MFMHNAATAIICVSFVINIICLPLYLKAEKLQEDERNIQDKMFSKVESIKRNFKGEQKFMLLSTYYRQNNYHPTMALRNSLSLLIQVPFFIAAYYYFSHLNLLNGQSFWFIKNLALCDAAIQIKGISINILPIIMTLVNLVSGEIYMKGFRFKDKIQLYALSVIFLVLLYNSPAALVIYWTINNILSLVKNFALKTGKTKYYFNLIYYLFIANVFYFFWLSPNAKFFYIIDKLHITFALYFFAALPLLVIAFKNRSANVKDFFSERKTTLITILSCLSLWMLCGLVIPSNIIASSPYEFSFVGAHKSPLELLKYPLAQGFGIFVFWSLYLYFLFNKKVKYALSVIMPCLLAVFIFNLTQFGKNMGYLFNTLQFQSGFGDFSGTPQQITINYLLNLCVIALLFFIIRKKRFNLLINTISIVLIGSIMFGIFNCIKIQSEFNKSLEYSKISSKKAQINLSKEKKNVVIIMLDRGASSFLPLIFKEKPQLKKQFSGFVYYPNTLSFYNHTILGLPPLYGGYEYTPEEMNKRSNEKMSKKHTEALLMLPQLFKNNDYDVSLFDEHWVNYEEITNPNFFTQRGMNYSDLNRRFRGQYKKDNTGTVSKELDEVVAHNLLYYSFLASIPRKFKSDLYGMGSYMNPNFLQTATLNIETVIDNYSALYYLPRITKSSCENNTLTILNNELTHTDTFLQYPYYKPVSKVTNKGKDFIKDDYSFKHYHVNAAAWLLLGNWMDYLKKEGVYDNTRIIIVSDHGTTFVTNPYFSKWQNEKVMFYNALLFVKDFNTNGSFKTDMTFMTNADVPLIASKNLITKPKNPFTGKELLANKKNGINILQGHMKWHPQHFLETTCLTEYSRFYKVKDNIFIESNWKEK